MTEFQPRLAVEYGGLIAVAYEMFAPMDAPFTAPKMPDGFKFIARVVMTDYFLNKTYPEVYGLIAQRSDLPNAFVLAIRGTADGVEWWPNLRVGNRHTDCGTWKISGRLRTGVSDNSGNRIGWKTDDRIWRRPVSGAGRCYREDARTKRKALVRNDARRPKCYQDRSSWSQPWVCTCHTLRRAQCRFSEVTNTRPLHVRLPASWRCSVCEVFQQTRN